MSRREKSEIVKDILELCLTPVGKTKVVYQCNLNFEIVKKYLSWCFNNGWLVRDEKGNSITYMTTELGKSTIDILKQSIPLIQF